ncbi:MAG: insulinase family protein [Bacteroidota bacterium]
MKKIMFILFLVIAFSITAQVDRSKMPDAGPAPEINIGDYESFELDNGLKVFVVENNKLPRVVFSLILHREPIMENENIGYISIAGQLLRTGTTTRPKDQLDEEVDYIGGTLSTSSTSVYAYSLKKHSEKILELMADVVLNPAFNKDELDKLKKQTISGIKAGEDEPGAIAANVRKALLYGKDHPYGEIQTVETTESVSLDMCKDYYNTYFHPNIAYMAVVGDITKDEAEELVTKYFSKWEKKDVPKPEYKEVKKPLVRKVAMVDRDNSVQSTISITYPIDLKVYTDEAIKARVMNYLLGGGASGELFQVLREEKGYTYGAYSSTNADRLIGNFTASCDARNEVTDSAVAAFIDVMTKFKSEKVSEEKLQAAKNYLTGSFSRSLESPQTVANFALNIARYNLPKDYYKTYLQKLNAVTADEVQGLAKKYVKPDKAHVLVVGKAGEVAGSLKRFSTSGKVDYYDIYGNKYDPSVSKIPAGVTVETVTDNYINAIGGKENIEKVKDKVSVIKGAVQGMEMKITISQKAPNKLFQELDAGMMKQSTIFDGTKGKQIAMGKEVQLEGNDLLETKLEATMNLFLDYKKHGITAELVGMDKVNGNDAYKVVLTLPNNNTWTQLYDVNSRLLVKQLSTKQAPQGTFTVAIEFDDYREVEGVKYPYKFSQTVGPQSMEMEVESIVVNSGLDDSMFEVK